MTTAILITPIAAITPVDLPVDPALLATLLLTPAADANTLHQQLAGQVGARPARRILAAAHGIAAERLWAAAS